MKMLLRKALLCLMVFTLSLQLVSPIFSESTMYMPSSWATQKMSIANSIGLLPATFNTQPFTKDITRLDFCELLVIASQLMTIQIPEQQEASVFTDTTSYFAQAAYLLGYTQGTSPGVFSPDISLTREMAAVMLSKLRSLIQPYAFTVESDYAQRLLARYAQDASAVSTWATTSMSDVYMRGILQGTGNGMLSPQKNLTREQAVILILNVITYCDESYIQSLGITDCLLPAPSSMYIANNYYRGDVYLEWPSIPLADAYDVTLFNDSIPVFTQRIYENYLDLRTISTSYNHELRASEITLIDNPLLTSIFGEDKKKISSSIEVRPVNRMGVPSLFSMKQPFIIDDWTNRNEKVFGDPIKTSFANDAEARLHMTSIKVYVWKMTASGEKKPATVTLTVNQNVAEDLKKVFDLIYNGSEKFPINGCGAYAFGTGRSEHSFGTAIDINPNENYFVTWDGVPKVGSFWQPGISPFSIPSGGDVVRAFNQVGWHWSPDMHWSNGADYMHFSLTGN